MRSEAISQARGYGHRFLSSSRRGGHRRHQNCSKNCRDKDPMVPPVAKKMPFTRSAHGVTWEDPYHWMSNALDPCVSRHLELENLYADSIMLSTAPLQSQLKEEMACRIAVDDISPPERWGPWLYYARISAGQDYPVYVRNRHSPSLGSWFQKLKRKTSKFLKQTQDDLHEQKLLDMNELIEGRGYAHLGVCKVSKDHRLLAYTVDFCGNEVFTLFVKDISTGALLSKAIARGVVSVEWARDSCSLLYTMADTMLRSSRVFKHSLGSRGEDILIYEEKDPQNFVDVSKTKDWQFFTINVNSKTSSEVYLLDADCCEGNLKLVERRRSGVEYFVEHQHGNLLLLTNAQMQHTQGYNSDYRLFVCPVGDLRLENWKQIILEEDDSVIYDMDIFEKYLVLFQRKGGLPQISIMDLPLTSNLGEKLRPHTLSLPKGVCNITPGLNQDYNSSVLRLSISSPIMPEALLDYNLSTKEYIVLQQDTLVTSDEFVSSSDEKLNRRETSIQESIGAEKLLDKRRCRTNASQHVLDLSNLYACEHLKVVSCDMVEVPLTVVYSHNLKVDGMNPALLTGYGAYGETVDLKWCSDYLSLLDRGWVLAFAHVRGGGELGKSWHDQGRLFQKLNSMHDFLACGDFLVKSGYARRNCLMAKGVSAGGLLVAAATNMRPDLFQAAILKV